MTLPDVVPEPISSETPLSELTTMRVGGRADRILVARQRDDLIDAAVALWEAGDPWLLLGGGSNTVVADEGYPGAVLLVRTTGIDEIDDPSLPLGSVRLRIQAGHDWDALVGACVGRGWAGIEALSGIPGLAGAAPVQNIGAYGQELAEVLHSIEFLDARTWEVERIAASDLQLTYRDSVIKQGREGVVLSIDLVLRASDTSPIAYGQLAGALDVQIGDEVSVDEIRRSVLRLRHAKGMVLDVHDHDSWSAGSFFVNPIVSETFARTLPAEAPRFTVGGSEPAPAVTTFEELASGVPMRLPDTPAPRRVKLSAAWLIEQSGLPRGFRLPGSGAAISSKHTLALTNRGGASAADVAELARFVVQRVQQEFGIVLVPEPNLYGLEV